MFTRHSLSVYKYFTGTKNTKCLGNLFIDMHCGLSTVVEKQAPHGKCIHIYAHVSGKLATIAKKKLVHASTYQRATHKQHITHLETSSRNMIDSWQSALHANARNASATAGTEAILS